MWDLSSLLLSLSVLSCGVHLSTSTSGNVPTVPVLLWGEDKANTSPQDDKLSMEKNNLQIHLDNVLYKKQDGSQPPLLVFLKDDLCAEDITQHKKKLEQMTSDGFLAYLPAVESALTIFQNQSSYNITMEDVLESISENQLAIVPTSDLNSIPEIYSMIKESSNNVVAALTGRFCRYNVGDRVKRQDSDNSGDQKRTDEIFIKDDKILMYINGTYLKLDDDKEYQSLGFPSGAKAMDKDNKTILHMVFAGIGGLTKIELYMQFNNVSARYYSLDQIQYRALDKAQIVEYTLKTNTSVEFPRNFSYHCSPNITFNTVNSSVALRLKGFQVQMYATKGNFSDAYDCVGFTSVPIWSGIFVSVILGLILLWGLVMIMDIRTMDRFDDPKGKTITVSAQE